MSYVDEDVMALIVAGLNRRLGENFGTEVARVEKHPSWENGLVFVTCFASFNAASPTNTSGPCDPITRPKNWDTLPVRRTKSADRTASR